MNRKALYISRKVLYRQAVLLVPVISIFIVVVLALYEAHRYRQYGRELVVTQKQITQLDTLIKDLDAKPPITVIPVILQSPVEQPDFIDVLRASAEKNHIVLNRWANATGPAGAGASTNVPAEVTAINCTIESAGTYNNLRRFLYSLQDAPRLFTLSDMVWTRNDRWPTTTLKFNLTRYVTASGSAPARMPAPTKAITDSVKKDSVVIDTSFWTSSSNNPLYPFPSTDYLSTGVNKASDSRGTQ